MLIRRGQEDITCSVKKRGREEADLNFNKSIEKLKNVCDFPINEIIISNLAKQGIIDLFPVQRLVLPYLMKSLNISCTYLRDICVSAPTGSGKTLSYVIPILQYLSNVSINQLQALIILPSRELAVQVYNVFSRMAVGTGIKICCATGQSSFETEQMELMGISSIVTSTHDANKNSLFTNRDLYELHTSRKQRICNDYGTASAATVLVSTPGRLLEHIQKTKGFSLRYLRFLVLDEADKLLGNAYHHWVRAVIHSTHSTSAALVGVCGLETGSKPLASTGDTTLHETNAIDATEACSVIAPSLSSLFSQLEQPLQRLLFSATLTDNPRKLALLGIRNPTVFRAGLGQDLVELRDEVGVGERDTEALHAVDDDPAVQGKVSSSVSPSGYLLPTNLTEAVSIATTSRRPLLLAAILAEAMAVGNTTDNIKLRDKGSRQHSGCCSATGDMCLVFASSVDSTHRLCRLLQALNGQVRTRLSQPQDSPLSPADQSYSGFLYGGTVLEMSSLLRAEERQAVMQAAVSGRVRVLVSSDQMARGIDLANIRLVINYDPPSHCRTYVHRVGRTARANKAGHAITMLKIGQSATFNKMHSQIDGKTGKELAKCKVSSDIENGLVSAYKKALRLLPKVLELESSGSLKLGAETIQL